MTNQNSIIDNVNAIKHFIRDSVKNANANGVIIGISGGVDSAVVAALAIDSLGKDKVYGVMLPYLNGKKMSETESIIKGEELCNILNISYTIYPIDNIVNQYKALNVDYDKLRFGNILARTRMTLLYDFAKENNFIVIGTTNKAEYYTGYFTKWGDGAVDIEPIVHLLKRDVFTLAKYLGVPKIIIDSKPSADLWADQTDEDEMEVTYKFIDETIDKYEKYANRFKFFRKNKDFGTWISTEMYKTESKFNKYYNLYMLVLSGSHKIKPIPNLMKI